MIPLLLAIICSGLIPGLLASPVSKADAYSDYSYRYTSPLVAYSAYSSYPSYNVFPYQGTVYPTTYSQPSPQYQVVSVSGVSDLDGLYSCSRLVTIIRPSPHTESSPAIPRTPPTPLPPPTPATPLPPPPPPRAPGIPPRTSSSQASSPRPRILTSPSLCTMPSSMMDLSPHPPLFIPPHQHRPHHHPLLLLIPRLQAHLLGHLIS